MQRFRFLPAVITISLASCAMLAHADNGSNDTPAQAAARAALLQQMNQMDATQAPGSSNSVTVSATPSTPTPEAKPAKAKPAKAKSAKAKSAKAKPVEANPTEANPTETKPPEPITQPAPPPAIAQPTPQFSTKVPVVSTPETGPAELTNETSDTNEMPPEPTEPLATDEKAGISTPPPAALTNETEEYPVNPPMTPLPSPAEATQTQTETPTPMPAVTEQTHPVRVPTSGTGGMWPTAVPSNASVPQLGFGIAADPGASLSHEPRGTNSTAIKSETPIMAPPLPISREKQSELQNLQSRYISNQITPVQYQEERARIMAEP